MNSLRRCTAWHCSGWVLVLLCLLLAGCDMPADPGGTYERAHQGVIRAGIADQPPWTRVNDGQPRGLEVELVQRFAASIDAKIQWRTGSQSELLEALEQGQLDLVVSGMTRDNPWASRIAMTQPYATRDGRKHVIAVPKGENRWLLALDQFLQSPAAQDRITRGLP